MTGRVLEKGQCLEDEPRVEGSGVEGINVEESSVEGGEVVDAATFKWSPLVWAPGHVAPNGDVMFQNGGLRMVNRTEHYRCKE